MSRQIFSQHFLMLMTKIFDHLSYSFYWKSLGWCTHYLLIQHCRLQDAEGKRRAWELAFEERDSNPTSASFAFWKARVPSQKKNLNAGKTENFRTWKTSNEQTKRRKGRGYKGTQSSLLKRYLLSQAITFMHLFSDICTFNNYYSCRLWLKYRKNF